MRILVIGGTVFLGRHFVTAALNRDHDVTIFHRGQHNPTLFDEVTRIEGDRRTDLDRLPDQQWDVVVDTCGYFPSDVEHSARALTNQAGRYLFVSTLSVFADLVHHPNLDENGALATTDNPEAHEITGENYGPLKALCEQVAEHILGDRLLVVRPGLIVGPHDASDRFTYWPHRMAQGGPVLVPDSRDNGCQFIDVRDLADWMLALAEDGQTGVFNATGPESGLTFGEVIETCLQETGKRAEPVWVDEHWLLEQGVGPWVEMPLWIPDAPGIASVDCRKAWSAGLRSRPLRETVRDTLTWAETRGDGHEWRAGLKPGRERELLDAWIASNPGSRA